MDTIEFRGMDSSIETVSTATASPASSTEKRCCNPPHSDHSCPENPENGHVYYSRCEDAKVHCMPDMYLTNTGRVLDVTMTLKRICPCRRVAVGVLVSEVDQSGNECSRGFKAITVPAHYNSSCCDIEMPRARFILPEDLRADGCTSMCDGSRHFIVRTEAHYVDSSVTMP